jgi:hypothetical protein
VPAHDDPHQWVEDARNLDNAEQLLHSAHGILLETPAIGDFLRNETNKRIVVAPKGYGKTFLLKSKRILLQRNSENLLCLPDNQLVDTTISDSPSLSRADVQRFIDYAFWCQILEEAVSSEPVSEVRKFPASRAGNLNRRSGKLPPSSGNPLSSAIWAAQSDPPRDLEGCREGQRGAPQIARVAEGPGRRNSLAERAPPRSPSGASRRGGVGQASRGRIQAARTEVMPAEVFVSTAIPLLTC